MKHPFRRAGAFALLSCGFCLAGQNVSAPGSRVTLTITHETKKGEASQLAAPEINVKEENSERNVLNLTPAGEKNAPIQLLLLIDDSAQTSFGTQIQSLRRFVSGLPENIEIGIGYMRNGTNQMTSKFTHDHKAAASTIRLPLGVGGSNVSPYDSLADAIKEWPGENESERKEVIMIGSGIEGLGGGFTPENPYVRRGIQAAQKAGVVVYTIYHPSYGSGRFFWRGTWGQNFLSQLADETGGEAYNINMGTPVSIDPFLDAILDQFHNQYLLTFEAKPTNKSDLQRVKISLKEEKGNIASASKAFVKASM